MTAIGAWCWDGLPVLIGDIALAGIDNESSAAVPTLKSIESVFPKGSGYVVSGVIQKLIVLSDTLAVAWSGPRFAAVEAVGVLRGLGKGHTSFDDIRAALSQLGDCTTNRNLVLLGWLRSDGEWRQFVFKDLLLQSFGCDEAMFAGSGEEELRAIHARATSAEMRGEADPRLVCACRCATTIGQLMRYELSFSKPILQYYGGGYEAVCVRYDRLQKLDVDVHVFWDGELVGTELRLRPMRILRNSYQEDRLVVRAADLKHEGNSRELRLTDQELHIVSAPDQAKLDERAARIVAPGFGAPVTCSHALLHADGRTIGVVNNVTTEHILAEDGSRDLLLVPDGLYEAIENSVVGTTMVGSA